MKVKKPKKKEEEEEVEESKGEVVKIRNIIH